MERGDEASGGEVASSETAVLSSGDRVLHRFFRKIGIIRAIEGEGAVLEIEGKTVRSPLSQFQLSADSEPPLPSLQNVTWNVREDTNPELNPIGRTAAEAVPETDRFLDRAFASRLPRIRLIHGFETGRLKRALAELLEGHPHVEKFPVEGGAASATIRV